MVADAFDRNIGLRKGADHLRIVSIAALPREKGRDAVCPEALNRCQDAWFVVNQHVVFGWKTPLNLIEGLFVVDVDEHTSINRIGKGRPLELRGRRTTSPSDSITVGPKLFSRLNTLTADANSRLANG
jgi:hypothetical protein